MKTFKATVFSFSALILVGVASGCGSGYDPLVSIGDPTVTPALNFPLATGGSFSQPQGYSAAHPSLEWTFTYSTTNNAVSAPAAGLVVAADATSITIMHSTRYTSMLQGLTTVSVRVNDYLVNGGAVGNLGVTGSLKWSFYVDGVVTCPASFLSASAKTTLNSYYSTLQFCQP